MRPAGKYKSHDRMTNISWSATFRRWDFPWLRFFSSVDGSKLIFYRGFTSVRPAGPAVIPRVHASGWG